MSTFIGLSLIGSLCILGLIALGLFAPPDGQERGDLAQFFGNFHPLAVHLPIALLLLVPILEIAGRNPRRQHLHASTGFVLGLAALSAIATPYLGWLLAWSGGFEGKFVTQHLWGGVTVATATFLCWILRRRVYAEPSLSDRRSLVHRTRAPYFGMLAIAVLAVALTGYRGGQLAHGEEHLTEHLPPSFKAWLGLSAARQTAAHGRAATFYSVRIAPIFEEHCLLCHGASKRKGGLQLDSYEGLARGGKDGVVVKPGNAQGSELFRRVSLEPANKDFMPAEGKPPLSEDDRKLLELWINAGASATVGIDAVAGAPALKQPAEPWAPDYRAQQAAIEQLAAALNVQLAPRSQNPLDGLVLRTASAPAACDDAALAKLAPLARYIVDAELARTPITDKGVETLAGFANLRTLDLSHTAITSAGVQKLVALPKLTRLNLTATAINPSGIDALRKKKSLTQVYLFQTQAAR